MKRKKLVRFDWAMKRLLRNKANFVILEGFLSELLGFDVSIRNILESGANKEDKEDKFNRVDMLVENTANHELIFVEVQNETEYDYFQRILYGASTLVTEYLENLHYEASMEHTYEAMKDEGRTEGRKEGRKEQAKETARRMLAEGLDIALIAKCTGLTADELAALADEQAGQADA